MFVHCRCLQVLESPNLVVPRGEHLQHRDTQAEVSSREPPGEEARKKLRTIDQGADPGTAVGSVGICRQICEMLFRLLVHIAPRPLKQRLIEVAVADFPGKIADRRIELTSNRDRAIKKRSKRSVEE